MTTWKNHPGTSATTLRKHEIAMIHIGAKGSPEKGGLGMDDDTYRAMLRSVAGVDSSTALDWRGRKLVIDHLKSKGAKFAPARKSGAKRLASEPQSKMARGLWIELHQLGAVRDPSEAALASYVKRQTRVDRLEWLNGKQAELVIEALKKWLERVLDAKAG